MDSTNTLKVVIDSTGAKTNVEKLDKSLKSLETQGLKTQKSFDDFSKKFTVTSKGIKDLSGNFVTAKQAASQLGISMSEMTNVLKKQSEELDKKNAKLKAYKDNLAVVGKAVGLVGGAMVTAAGTVAAFTAAYAKSASELQNQAVLADANVVEFQRLAVAAQRYGITQGDLSDKLKDFNEKLGEFTASGSGGAKDAFEMLYKNGLMTTEQIKKLALEMQAASGPQALQMYVNELEKAGVSQEQMSWYLETMASDFTKLAPALADNGAEMKRLADEAERLGVIMDESAVQQALKLEEQMNTMKMQIKGATNTIMAEAVPAMVDIAEAIFGASEQGNGFSEVAATAAKMLRILAAAAVGAVSAVAAVGKAMGGLAAIGGTITKDMSWYEMNPFGLAKAAYNNRKAIKEIASAATDDVKTTFDKAGKTIEGIMSNEFSSKIAIKPPKKSGGGGSGVNAGLDEELNKMNEDAAKGAKERKKAADKAALDAERAAEEIARIRERFEYSHADKVKQIEIDLQKDLAEIRKAGLGSEYEERAKKWAELEKQYFNSRMDYENKEFKLNEREKLSYKLNLDKIAAEKDKQLTEEQKRAKLAALTEEHQFEVDRIQLSSDKRMFEAEREFMSKQAQIKKKGELERREIELNSALTEEERKKLVSLSERKTDRESNESRTAAWNNLESMSGDLYGTSELINIKTQLEERRAIIEEARAQELIDTEEYNKRMRDIEFDAWTQRQQFNISQAEATFGSATEIMKNAFGEQSKAYQVMFAIEKSFAVANAGLAMANNIAKAASLGFPANIPMIAGAMAQAAQIASLVASVAAPKTAGFAEGGYTGDGGKYDVAGLVHRGEIVWSQADIKRAGGKNVVEGMRTGQSQQQTPLVSPVNNNIANFFDLSMMERYLQTDEGKRALVNVVSDNKSDFARVLR